MQKLRISKSLVCLKLRELREQFSPKGGTTYRGTLKKRDFLEVLHVGISPRLSQREFCTLWTICRISERGNTGTSVSGELWWKKKKSDGRFIHPRTILAYLCASVTRSISNMTSSSTVGYSGSFFSISCSIRWYNSTSYLQKNKKHKPRIRTNTVGPHLTLISLSQPPFFVPAKRQHIFLYANPIIASTPSIRPTCLILCLSGHSNQLC